MLDARRAICWVETAHAQAALQRPNQGGMDNSRAANDH
jgi:hypothetical protein